MINNEILVPLHLSILFLQYTDFICTENDIQIYTNNIWKAMMDKNNASFYFYSLIKNNQKYYRRILKVICLYLFNPG